MANDKYAVVCGNGNRRFFLKVGTKLDMTKHFKNTNRHYVGRGARPYIELWKLVDIRKNCV